MFLDSVPPDRSSLAWFKKKSQALGKTIHMNWKVSYTLGSSLLLASWCSPKAQVQSHPLVTHSATFTSKSIMVPYPASSSFHFSSPNSLFYPNPTTWLRSLKHVFRNNKGKDVHPIKMRGKQWHLQWGGPSHEKTQDQNQNLQGGSFSPNEN